MPWPGSSEEEFPTMHLFPEWLNDTLNGRISVQVARTRESGSSPSNFIRKNRPDPSRLSTMRLPFVANNA